ncbi:MAG: DUF3536 domain-containing protein [Spirochaetota bacterium]|nr:DUF3536 domain-containing protein [Spirochaetota bacterium]
MINHLIFHGHFYQPPREDPWTGLVNTQPSAAPFHDWNHRITRECYAANSASRFLRYDGRIEDIINNYRVLSFNFGPTLMWWLRQHAPYVYEAIIEADRLSIGDNGGHGNAIAQAYNHTILPLDDPRDARIQIQWGIADFEFHFGRRSEGIWLPETAVNEAVIDMLIEEKINFIVLSPWQAEAIHTRGMEEWKELKEEPAPFWRPYRIKRPGGTINIFFYNNEIAQGISFEHYLRNADALYSRLLPFHSDADPGHLVHVATDGEVYGHHEPFGDMCLAALQKKIAEKEDFVFTNYGAYLEKHPPVYDVRLRKGEQELGTSWSCHHGVSRWFKDCGCSTGGEINWNQKWRTPLREGLRGLSAKLWDIYRSETGKYSDTDPLDLLKEYISVLTGRLGPADFARMHLKPEKRNEESVESMLTLLEGQKYRLYSFTSCGWFFADIDGIEATQNIRYALKAIQLYRNFTDEDLFEYTAGTLAGAVSNKAAGRTGSDIMRDQDSYRLGDGVEAASYFFIRILIRNPAAAGSTYGYYTLISEETAHSSESTHLSTIEVLDNTRQKKFRFRFKAILDETEGIAIWIDDLLEPKQKEYIEELSKLPLELRKTLMRYIVRSTEKTLAEQTVHTFEQTRFAISQARFLGIEAPRLFEKSAELSVTTLLQGEMGRDGGSLDKDRISRLEDILHFASRYEIRIDKAQINSTLNRFIRDLFQKQDTFECDEKCLYIARFIKALRESGIEPDLTIPQKRVFALLQKWRTRLHGDQADKGLRRITKKQLASLKDEEQLSVSRLLTLCDAMGIYDDDIKPAFGHG